MEIKILQFNPKERPTSRRQSWTTTTPHFKARGVAARRLNDKILSALSQHVTVVMPIHIRHHWDKTGYNELFLTPYEYVPERHLPSATASRLQ